MCIMLYISPGATFPQSKVQEWFGHNSDGLGSVFARDGKLHVDKTLARDAIDANVFCAQSVARANGAPLIIHFRYATSGLVDDGGTHPHMVRSDLAIAHNGVLSIEHDADKESDTQAYVRDYLRPVLGTCKDPIARLRGPLGKVIGAHVSGSKFVLMDKHGEVAIINPDAGHWSGGVWYSFRAWVRPKHKKLADYYDGYPPAIDTSLGLVWDRWQGQRYR